MDKTQKPAQNSNNAALSLDEALIILEKHNLWRRDNEGEMENPKRIGEAFDVIIKWHKAKKKRK
jgi:hypothetical protein